MQEGLTSAEELGNFEVADGATATKSAMQTACGRQQMLLQVLDRARVSQSLRRRRQQLLQLPGPCTRAYIASWS